MKLTSIDWRLTFAVIILEHIDIKVKEKVNISDFNIKSQQDKLYINNIRIIDKDISIEKITYILLTKKIKTVIKTGRLEFIIQSNIKIDIKEESLIKTQESIMDKMHIHITIK